MNRPAEPHHLAADLHTDGSRIEQRIDQLWTELADHLEHGQLTTSQYEWILAQEADWGDQGPTSRWVFSHFLARCAARPHLVGITSSDDHRYRCGTCRDLGMLEAVPAGGWYPCRTCQPRAFELWAAGHYHPNHTCAECAPTRRSRGRAGASHEEELAHERQQHDRAARHERERRDLA